MFLSQTAKKVLLMIRGDSLSKKMSQYLVRRIEQTDNIEVLTNTNITKIRGNEVLNAVEIVNNQTNETQIIEPQLSLFSSARFLILSGYLLK